MSGGKKTLSERAARRVVSDDNDDDDGVDPKNDIYDNADASAAATAAGYGNQHDGNSFVLNCICVAVVKARRGSDKENAVNNTRSSCSSKIFTISHCYIYKK